MVKKKSNYLFSSQSCGAHYPDWQRKCCESNQSDKIHVRKEDPKSNNQKTWAIGLDHKKSLAVSIKPTSTGNKQRLGSSFYKKTDCGLELSFLNLRMQKIKSTVKNLKL